MIKKLIPMLMFVFNGVLTLVIYLLNYIPQNEEEKNFKYTIYYGINLQKAILSIQQQQQKKKVHTMNGGEKYIR